TPTNPARAPGPAGRTGQGPGGRARREIPKARREGSRRISASRLLPVDRRPERWHLHPERRPHAFSAGDLDPAPVGVHDLLRMIETDTPSALLRRPEGGEHRVP